MASVISHAAAAAAIAHAAAPPDAPARYWAAAIVCAVIPDADAIGFWLGIPYGSVFGHRGITHSILFAALATGAAAAIAFPHAAPALRNRVLCGISLATLSHGLLDAATDGGLGVAFFSPFSNARYFFPFRPIVVLPIGIRSFLSARGIAVLRSEALWIGIPSLALTIVAGGIRWIRALAK